MGKDILGGFNIPSHLLEKAAAYVPPAPPKKKAKPTPKPTLRTSKITLTTTPQVVKKYKGSNGTSIHTVTGYLHNGGAGSPKVKLECTCQGFRIQKKGYCKHTKLAAVEFDL